MFRILAILFIIIACSLNSSASKAPFYSDAAERWADSIMAQMTPDQRLGQLFMIAAWSNKDSVHIKEIQKLITDWNIGGLIFFQGGPVRQARLTNDYQKLSKIPLMIGMDAEWGLAMRIDSTIRYPRQMTLSAVNDDSLVYKMGVQIARQCKRLGVHINFAPDADINNNPLNPIIGSRSFGDERESVARRSIMYMNGMQHNRVLANGKHFPGHGNADTDSHLALPTILQPKEILDSIELYPFQKLIDNGVSSMMVAHLNVPALESSSNLPSTLSYKIVNDLLKKKMNFKGLIFTDALNMKGVSACYRPGYLDKLALLAGNDVLLYSEDVRKAIEEIHIAIENCEIKQEEVDERIKKVLMAKYWCGLNEYRPIELSNLYRDLNDYDGINLQRELYEKAATVLLNKDSLLPLKLKNDIKIASVVVGDVKNNAFQEQLAQYGKIDLYSIDKDAPADVFKALFTFLDNYDYIVLSMHGTSMKAQSNFGIGESAQRFIDTVIIKYKTVFVDFGNAYTLSRFKALNKAKALILSYEDFPLTHSIAAQIIMGGVKASGKLPVNLTQFPILSGVETSKLFRLSYSAPEAVGISSYDLLAIDSLVLRAIADSATPGCQVLIAKDGKVIYRKSFGSKQYSPYEAVVNSDLYDIASVTKIVGAGLATMKLYDDHKIELTNPVGKYLSKLKSTDKRSLTLKEIMAHQAGLLPFVPMAKFTMNDSTYIEGLFTKVADDDHTIRVCDSMYMLKSYSDSVRHWIFESTLTERGKYVYSDIGPILMKEVAEHVTGDPLDVYLNEKFYQPLNLPRLTYRPYEKYTITEIVPTELDKTWRKKLIRGDVHDPSAAMMGGVSGNAGIFSNANDLAIIMQMLLNGGTYGGRRFLKQSTIDLFTSRAFPDGDNRRGLLFDKPGLTGKSSPCAPEASPLTFGHQGFTGTCVWADPKYDLIIVFLSNRINPDVSNEKLGKMNIRTSVQQIVYKSILKNLP